jgi:hypothetical protein
MKAKTISLEVEEGERDENLFDNAIRFINMIHSKQNEMNKIREMQSIMNLLFWLRNIYHKMTGKI